MTFERLPPLPAHHPAITAGWKCRRCKEGFKKSQDTAGVPYTAAGGTVVLFRLMHIQCAISATRTPNLVETAARDGRKCEACGAAVGSTPRFNTMTLCWVCARLWHTAQAEAGKGEEAA